MPGSSLNIAAFVVLVMAALLGAWLQARRRPRENPIAQRIQLGAHHNLFVVEVDGRRMLIGIGPASAPRLLTGLAQENISQDVIYPSPLPYQGQMPKTTEQNAQKDPIVVFHAPHAPHVPAPGSTSNARVEHV